MVGLSSDRERSIELRLDQLATLDPENRSFDFALFLAADDDRLVSFEGAGLAFSHKPGFQTTQYPCELLFRGSYDELVSAASGGAFDQLEDAVEHLDRLFLVRVSEGSVDQARSVDDFAAATTDAHWYAIIADSPFEARHHVVDHPSAELARDGGCPQCHIRVLADDVVVRTRRAWLPSTRRRRNS